MQGRNISQTKARHLFAVCLLIDCFSHRSVCPANFASMQPRSNDHHIHESSEPTLCSAQRSHLVTALLSSPNKALLSVVSSRDSRSPSITGVPLICCSNQLKIEQPTFCYRLSCNDAREVQREQALAEKRNPQPPRVVSFLPLSRVCSILANLYLWMSASNMIEWKAKSHPQSRLLVD